MVKRRRGKGRDRGNGYAMAKSQSTVLEQKCHYQGNHFKMTGLVTRFQVHRE
jgi:hypothetical protein